MQYYQMNVLLVKITTLSQIEHLKRNSDKHYFELHHVISFGAKQSGDILENLVKLCPACHRALTLTELKKAIKRNY